MSELDEYVVQELEDRIKELMRDAKARNREIARLEKSLSSAYDVTTGQIRVPTWTKKKPSTKAHVGRPVLMLSDLHFQEVVDPRTMNGVNEYNHDVSVRRFERVINRSAEWTKRYTAGLDFDGGMVMLGGDIVTGTIHEELQDTNDRTTPEAVVEWAPRIASALEYLADEWGGQLVVPMVDGNHDRVHKRKRMKQRAEEAWSWVLYNWVAHSLEDNEGITPLISSASELIVPLYDTHFLIEHGDEGVGPSAGSGIGGIFPPIARKVHKSQSKYANWGQKFDWNLMGHWHQTTYGPNFIINGSLKGYDEYAMKKGFGFERPQQCLFVVTPENGITMKTEIYGE